MLRKGGGRASPAPGRRELGGERGSLTAARKPCQTAVAAAASRLYAPSGLLPHRGTPAPVAGRAAMQEQPAVRHAHTRLTEQSERCQSVPIAIKSQSTRRQVPERASFPQGGAEAGADALIRYARGGIRRRSVARECGVSGPTANAYFGILDATLLARCLPSWRRRAARRLMAGPKLYVEDVRVVNRLARRGERSAVPTPPGRRSRTECSTSSRRTSRIATSTSNCTSRGIDMLPATDFARRLRQGDLDPAA